MTEWTAGFGDAERLADEALADLEREKAKLREVGKIWEEASTTVRAKDNSFAMTFDGRGELTELVFNGSKYRTLAPAHLAHLIVETLRAGRAQAVAKVQEVMGHNDSGSGARLDFAGLASGKVDPMDMVNELIGPLLEGLDGIGAAPDGDDGGNTGSENRRNAEGAKRHG